MLISQTNHTTDQIHVDLFAVFFITLEIHESEKENNEAFKFLLGTVFPKLTAYHSF